LEGDERIILAQPANWRQHADALRSNRGRPTPRVLRRGHGVDNRMDRLRAIGNGVDVDVAEWIGRRIMECG
jgi:site-specific DNA-cytosine methylase